MTKFQPGQEVRTQGGAKATFVRYISIDQCIVRHGFDTRIVNPVTLSTPQEWPS